MDLSHLDEKGRVRMVDVTEKQVTDRRAVAYGEVRSATDTIRKISADEMGKGDVLTTAKIAGISAAKRTGDLIPMCHPIPLTHVEIDITLNEDVGTIGILATAVASGKTGVEMEALTAVSVAALTVYDMCKAVDRTMEIASVLLVEKHGGKSGSFRRPGWQGPGRPGTG